MAISQQAHCYVVVSAKSMDNPELEYDDKDHFGYGEVITVYATRAVQTTPRHETLTPVIAIDCEFQQAYVENLGKRIHRVGRVSIVNYFGQVIYDVFAHYPEMVGYTKKLPLRARQLGVYAQDIDPVNGARPIEEVEHNVRNIIFGRVVVGHSILNDVKVFSDGVFNGVAGLRDTQLYVPYRLHATGSERLPALSVLARDVLGKNIQGVDHSSVEDAQATMELYLRAEAKMVTMQEYVQWFWTTVKTKVAMVTCQTRTGATSKNQKKRSRAKRSRALKMATCSGVLAGS